MTPTLATAAVKGSLDQACPEERAFRFCIPPAACAGSRPDRRGIVARCFWLATFPSRTPHYYGIVLLRAVPVRMLRRWLVLGLALDSTFTACNPGSIDAALNTPIKQPPTSSQPPAVLTKRPTERPAQPHRMLVIEGPASRATQ